MDEKTRQAIREYLELPEVRARIEEARAAHRTEHLADAANYDWCDCDIHDPRT